MAEEKKKSSEPERPEEVEIAIKYNLKTGNVGIRGIIKNEMIALYMLEKARDIVKGLNMPKPPSIVRPKGKILDFMRGKK